MGKIQGISKVFEISSWGEAVGEFQGRDKFGEGMGVKGSN